MADDVSWKPTINKHGRTHLLWASQWWPTFLIAAGGFWLTSLRKINENVWNIQRGECSSIRFERVQCCSELWRFLFTFWIVSSRDADSFTCLFSWTAPYFSQVMFSDVKALRIICESLYHHLTLILVFMSHTTARLFCLHSFQWN